MQNGQSNGPSQAETRLNPERPKPPEAPRLVLFPGLGADGRLFEPQREAFPHLKVPQWLEPRLRESLSEYGRRMAEGVVEEPGVPVYLGGASFGGAVALEVARHVRPRAVFLI